MVSTLRKAKKSLAGHVLDPETSIFPHFNSADELGAFAQKFIQNVRLPLPGQGNTWERWQKLSEWGNADLSLAKILESHFDALTILDEAGLSPHPGLYAVWASKHGGKKLQIQSNTDQAVVFMRGEIPFASGHSFVQQALVLVPTDAGEQLYSLTPKDYQVQDQPLWEIPHMGLCGTAWLQVNATLPRSAAIGPPGHYLSRSGFWMGGMGVAAVWLGAAQALFEIWKTRAEAKTYEDPHERAELARHYVQLRSASLYLRSLADALDQHTLRGPALEREALALRHAVDDAANSLIQTALRCQGPGLLLSSPEFRRKMDDLLLFTRQCHGEKDLAFMSQSLRSFEGDWFEFR